MFGSFGYFNKKSDISSLQLTRADDSICVLSERLYIFVVSDIVTASITHSISDNQSINHLFVSDQEGP